MSESGLSINSGLKSLLTIVARSINIYQNFINFRCVLNEIFYHKINSVLKCDEWTEPIIINLSDDRIACEQKGFALFEK